jgi:hypothetical protein
MKKLLSVYIVYVCVLSVWSVLFAGNNPEAKAAIHVRPHIPHAGCNVAINGCEDIVTTEASFSVDAFPVFFNLNEYKGCSYSLDWPDWSYSAMFTSCSDFVIGYIYHPGHAQVAVHTWDYCQTGMCIPGYVWLYADYAGMICPAWPNTPGFCLCVVDCEGGFNPPVRTYCAGIYGAIGDDPWCTNATEPTTWGDIKSLFGE